MPVAILASPEEDMASELAFRAKLILLEQRKVFDYWRLAASGEVLPRAEAIDPAAIPNLLPGLSLIDASSGLDSMVYRVAGTRVREIYGVEVTGRKVFDLDFGSRQRYWKEVYGNVMAGPVAMQGAIVGPLVNRDHILLVWLRLPLKDANGNVARILGYDGALPAMSVTSRDRYQSATPKLPAPGYETLGKTGTEG